MGDKVIVQFTKSKDKKFGGERWGSPVILKMAESFSERYSMSDLQGMSSMELYNLIKSKKVTWNEVDAALEKSDKANAMKVLDRVGDLLARDEIKGA